MTTTHSRPSLGARILPERRLKPGHVVTTLAATALMYGAGLGFVLQQSSGEYGVWAPLSDAAATIFGLSLIPLVRGVVAELDTAGAPFIRPARAVGLAAAGMIITGGSTLLVTGALGVIPQVIASGGLAVQFMGLAVLGAWLALTGVQTLRTRRWSRLAGWAAVISGAGYVGGIVTTALQMFDSPLFALAYAATLTGFVTWLITLLRATR